MNTQKSWSPEASGFRGGVRGCSLNRKNGLRFAINTKKSEVLLSIVGNGGLLSGLAVAALWVHPIGAPSLLPRDHMFAIEF